MIKKLIRPIFQSGHTFVLGTVGAAKHYAAGFVSVADDTAAAVGAFRREGVDGAFERVEVMRNAVHDDFERLIVLVAADFAGLDAGVELVFRLVCHVWFGNPRATF